MKKMTVAILTCDSYSDAWEICSISLNKNWNDIHFDKVLISDKDNDSAYFDDKISIIEDNWSKRLNKALDKIESEFVFIMLEDQFPIEKVDNQKVHRILEYMDCNKDIAVVYLENGVAGLGKSVEHNDWLNELPYGIPYRISCSPSIWRIDFLKKITQKNYSAWEFEKIGSYDNVGKKITVLEVKTSNWTRIDPAGAISRGKWTYLVPGYAESLGVRIDYRKRSVQSKVDILKIKMRNIVFGLNPELVVKVQNKIYNHKNLNNDEVS